MTRLAQNDLAELRLRLRSSEIRSEVTKRLTFDDVARVLDEIEECWAGNLPEWAGWDTRTNTNESADYEDVSPLPHWAVKRIEESAERCEQIARTLQNHGLTAAATVWREVEDELYELAEEIESDEAIRTEEKEERRCTDDSRACQRRESLSACPDGGDPSGPASAARKRRA